MYSRVRVDKYLYDKFPINHLNAELIPILLTWGIGWAPNNARKWQMGFNLEFIGLNPICHFQALLEAHNILHVSRIRIKMAWKKEMF